MALDLTQMVLENRKNLKPTHFYMLNIFGFNNFPIKSSPGGVLALSLLLSVYGLGLGPEILNVGNHLKPIQFYTLSNFCVTKCAQKSTSGGVLALLLLLAVYGSGLGPDGPGEPEEP